MTRKGLSIHVSTLEKMIEGNYIYVDKTETCTAYFKV